VMVRLRTGLDPFPAPRGPAPPFLASLMFTAEDPWSSERESGLAGREERKGTDGSGPQCTTERFATELEVNLIICVRLQSKAVLLEYRTLRMMKL
jgi:hypothetical protein